jgi:DNA-binding NtrC family response regulator
MHKSGLNIIIAEDDLWYAELLKHHISLNPDNQVEVVSSGKELLQKNLDQIDVITLDYTLPDSDGASLLKQIKKKNPSIEIIIVSGQEDIKTAVSLINGGAYDYLVKDEETKDRLWRILIQVQKKNQLKEEVRELRSQVQSKFEFSKSIIGQNAEIKSLYSKIEKASRSNISVSISGETGTGKEVLAKAVHSCSDRKKHPFVAINLSAIPETLIESELFGHEKGAFTDASYRRIGKFEQAGKGTLFLDEIGELPLSHQAKLLRVLQEREIQRVGGEKTIPIDCRIITATHRDLGKMVGEGTFRQDLFYRIIGLPLHLPALRERRTDIPLLAKHFLKTFCLENELEQMSISGDAMDKLLRYYFPGNVRELKSIIELAATISESIEIGAENIHFQNAQKEKSVMDYTMTLREQNLHILEQYLDKFNGNITKVASMLDIGKSTIYRMIKERKHVHQEQ